MIGVYPQTANLRYLAPPVTVAACAVGLASTLAAVAGPRWLAWGGLAPAGYLVGVGVAAGVAGRGLPARARAWLAPVLATMHLSWGTGFLLGVREAAGTRSGSARAAVDYPGAASGSAEHDDGGTRTAR